eukprot:TRINITY_DN7696_c0_g1_i1.p1 TRINITY_DN7696_c0_g1~~TRINITY_DN7696_c0_g1_i1.p1  ORF type:complete len:152 (+),score=32.56 TRINITY_DN7696_c0_g1_i1:39-458(+)
MKSLWQFWEKMEERLKDRVAEDLQFTQEVSKHDLRSLIKAHLGPKEMKVHIEKMLERLRKHLPRNQPLFLEIWDKLTTFLLQKYERFEKLVQDCYQTEKLTLSSMELRNLVDTVTPIRGSEREKSEIRESTVNSQQSRS